MGAKRCSLVRRSRWHRFHCEKMWENYCESARPFSVQPFLRQMAVQHCTARTRAEASRLAYVSGLDHSIECSADTPSGEQCRRYSGQWNNVLRHFVGPMKRHARREQQAFR